MSQKFDVALRAFHRREGQAQNGEAQFSRQCNEVVQHLFMGLRFPDHALFAHFVPSGLELGLDKAQHLALAGFQQIFDSRKDDFQRNETHVNDAQVQRLPQVLCLHIADVGPLHDDHTGVISNLPVQLAVAHIDGKDFFRSLLQQAIREAAGGSAGIAAYIVHRMDSEVPQGLFQLQAAPAHIGAGGSPDLNIHGLLIGNAGLVCPLAVHIH